MTNSLLSSNLPFYLLKKGYNAYRRIWSETFFKGKNSQPHVEAGCGSMGLCRVWEMDDFDPLVNLLIEACAVELKKFPVRYLRLRPECSKGSRNSYILE